MNTRDLVQSNEESVSCYMYEIPPFVEKELVRSYETLHASLPFFRIFRSLLHANCYVARRHGHPYTILLFTCQGRSVEVLNEMIEVEQAELDRFVRYIFSRFARIDVISFKAVKAEIGGFAFPVQKHDSKSTYVIALPGKPEEYTASIGKSTRAGLRHQMNNVVRDFLTFKSEFFVNEDVDEQYVRDIIRFSEQKLHSQGVNIAHDVDRILALVRACGFVNVFLIDGRICAGSINYRVGTSCFGEVTGYDPRYEKYGLGKLSVHQTICESIRRGARKFYLGGGVFDFKKRMLGVPLCMDELTIYRSYPRMLRNLDRVLTSAASGYLGYLKNVLHRHKQKAWARYAFRSFYFFKNKIAD